MRGPLGPMHGWDWLWHWEWMWQWMWPMHLWGSLLLVVVLLLAALGLVLLARRPEALKAQGSVVGHGDRRARRGETR